MSKGFYIYYLWKRTVNIPFMPTTKAKAQGWVEEKEVLVNMFYELKIQIPICLLCS